MLNTEYILNAFYDLRSIKMFFVLVQGLRDF